MKFFLILLCVLLNLGAIASQNVSLAWDASPDSSVTGYNIYYGIDSNYLTNKLDAGTNTTGTIQNLAVGYGYYFEVTAYNAWAESLPSNIVFADLLNFSGLNLRASPFSVFDLSPPTQNLIIGTPILITAPGLNPLFYQWQHNGTNITGATKAYYSVSSAQVANQGYYQLIVSNIDGVATSSVSSLGIFTKPVIVTQPIALTSYIDSNVVFSVVVSGTSPFQYQWTLNSSILSDATNSSLPFTIISTNQAGNYAVTIYNIAGSILSHNARLTIK